jgi:Galactosyltransferase
LKQIEVEDSLRKRVNDCHDEKKSLISSLETEKERHQKTSGKLEMAERSIRTLNQDKAVLEANLTIHREFFRYASSMLRDKPYPGVDNYNRYTVARLGMSPLAGIKPLRPEFGPVINDVTSFRYPISVPACGTRAANGRPSVFVAVVSAAGNADKRNRIRQTWRTHLDVDYHKSSMVVAGFAFVLGLTGDQATQSKIEQESREHGDVIQIEMSDFYRNLSLKVAGLFNWLHSNCLDGLDFLFKVDDDVYVNVRNLAHFVQSHNRSEQSIFGNSAANLFPARGIYLIKLGPVS